MMDEGNEDDAVGRGRPPIASQFKAGQSGNPKGRPKNKGSKRPEDVILDQIVPVRENGIERMMRADRAFLLDLTSKGLAMGGATARAAREALSNRPSRSKQERKRIVFSVYPAPGDVGKATRTLQITTLLDAQRPTAHLRLETWIVEAAIARLDNRQLSVEQQQAVVAAARYPHKINWPEWWTA